MSVTKRLLCVLMAVFVALPVACYAKKKKKEKTMLTTEQRQKTIDWLNENGWWRLSDVRWAQNDDLMESYLRSLPNQGLDAIAATRKMLQGQLTRVNDVLALRHDLLLGVPRGQEASALLPHFKDIEGVTKSFGQAQGIKLRCERLITHIDSELSNRKPKSAPTGHLLSLEYSTHNGFAGRSDEMKLTRNPDGTGTLVLSQRRMRMERDFKGEEGKTSVVPDSVMTSVERIILDKRTYEMGDHYDSDYEIMDASSWSLSVQFENGSFSSGGYASWPDSRYGLSEILSLISKCGSEEVKE